MQFPSSKLNVIKPCIYLVLIFTPTFFAAVASAAPVFSQTEIITHQQKIDIITATASQCLESVYEDHVEFFETWKISKYYGDRHPLLATPALRRQQLKLYDAPVSLEPELKPISCIGLTVRCLGEGFAAAGQSATWSKIYAELRVDNKLYGTDLQKMLHQLGWKTLYWNPDPTQNAKWDLEDQTLSPLQPGFKKT